MARPLDMKVSFTDETLEKIAGLKTELQLREDMDLLMRSIGALAAKWDDNPFLPTQMTTDDARGYLMRRFPGPTKEPPLFCPGGKHVWQKRDGFNECQHCFAVGGRSE